MQYLARGYVDIEYRKNIKLIKTDLNEQCHENSDWCKISLSLKFWVLRKSFLKMLHYLHPLK